MCNYLFSEIFKVLDHPWRSLGWKLNRIHKQWIQSIYKLLGKLVGACQGILHKVIQFQQRLNILTVQDTTFKGPLYVQLYIYTFLIICTISCPFYLFSNLTDLWYRYLGMITYFHNFNFGSSSTTLLETALTSWHNRERITVKTQQAVFLAFLYQNENYVIWNVMQ